MVSKISIQRPYLLLLLYYGRLLAVILPLKVVLHLAHYLRVLEDPLLLHVELASQLYQLILLNQ